MRNDVIFAVESSLMIISIMLDVFIIAFLLWHRGRETLLSVDDLEKIEKLDRRCP